MIEGININVSQYPFPRFFITVYVLNVSLRLRHNKENQCKVMRIESALSKHFDGLVSFGQMDIADKMVTLAEKFLVCCIF